MLEAIWNFIFNLFSAIWTFLGDMIAAAVDAAISLVIHTVFFLLDAFGLGGTIVLTWILAVIAGVAFYAIMVGVFRVALFTCKLPRLMRSIFGKEGRGRVSHE